MIIFYLPVYSVILKPSPRLALSHQDFSLKSLVIFSAGFSALMALQSSFLLFLTPGFCGPPSAQYPVLSLVGRRAGCAWVPAQPVRPQPQARHGALGSDVWAPFCQCSAIASSLTVLMDFLLFHSFPLPIPRGSSHSPKVLSLAWTCLDIFITSPHRSHPEEVKCGHKHVTSLP